MSDREVIALKAEVRALRALVEALEERVRVLESNSFEVITPTAESPRQAFTPPPRTTHLLCPLQDLAAPLVERLPAA